MLRAPLLVIVVVLLAFVSAACTEPLPIEATGSEVFSHSCSRCHGAALQGRAPAPRLAGADAPSAEFEKQYYVDTVTIGSNRMPSFGSQLTPEHIDRVVDYIMEQQGR